MYWKKEMNDMETRMEIIVDAANGFRYRFVEFWNHIITYYWDKNYQDWRQNGRTFKTMEEAVAWAEHFGKEEEAKPSTYVPNPEEEERLKADWFADFYGCGRYCGD